MPESIVAQLCGFREIPLIIVDEESEEYRTLELNQIESGDIPIDPPSHFKKYGSSESDDDEEINRSA